MGPPISSLMLCADGLCAMDGETRATEANEVVKSTLECAGFCKKNTVWTPTQWLGFVVDLSKGHIEIPHERLSALQNKLDSACKVETLCARQLASVLLLEL